MALPKRSSDEPNGADAAALHICDFLACEKEILEIVGWMRLWVPPSKMRAWRQLIAAPGGTCWCGTLKTGSCSRSAHKTSGGLGRWDTSVGGTWIAVSPLKPHVLEIVEELGIRPNVSNSLTIISTLTI
ncbi:MAG: hypothetical protein R2875_01470 [Desulfobacterales bacterium]